MSITVKQKRFMFGDTFSNAELLSALNTDFFEDEAPIHINSENYQGILYAIYQLEDTYDIVLCGNNINIEGEPLFEVEEINVLIKKYTKKIYSLSETISKKELVKAIKNAPSTAKIYLQTVADLEQGVRYCLTSVCRCSELCPIVHLDSFYGEYSFLQN